VSFPRVGIVGLGLIGGSLAKRIREVFPDTHIVGVSRNQSACAQAIADGVLSAANTEISVLADRDLVFVATPIETIVDTVKALQAILSPSAIVTDVASVKGDIVAALSASASPRQKEGVSKGLRPLDPVAGEATVDSIGGKAALDPVCGEATGVQGAEPLENSSLFSEAEPRKKALFIGGHPMAGKETTGYAASEAKMLIGATYVLMPSTDPRHQVFETYLKNLKFRVVTMSPEDHDEAVALASHGPYVMACLTAGALLKSPYADAGKQLISSGFRDTTRVACSPAEWGTAVCLDNADAVLGFLQSVSADIGTLSALIRAQDAAALTLYFETIAVHRRGLFPV
jgi:prephenate dehydrogenase